MADSKKDTKAPDGSNSSTEGAAKWLDTTTILVGPYEQKFIAHTCFLREIPFFRGCLDAKMQESAEGLVRLPEDDPEVFSQILSWTYGAKFNNDLVAIAKDRTSSNGTTAKARAFCAHRLDVCINLIKTYSLAQKFLAEPIQNAVLDELRVAWVYYIPGSWTVEAVYEAYKEHKNRDDALLRLTMQRLSNHVATSSNYVAWADSNPDVLQNFARKSMERMEFLMEALARFPNAKNPHQDPNASKCKWHMHTTTKKCA